MLQSYLVHLLLPLLLQSQFLPFQLHLKLPLKRSLFLLDSRDLLSQCGHLLVCCLLMRQNLLDQSFLLRLNLPKNSDFRLCPLVQFSLKGIDGRILLLDYRCHLSILSEQLFVLIEEYGRHEGDWIIPALLRGRPISELLDIGIVGHDHTRCLLEVQSRSGFLDEKRST